MHWERIPQYLTYLAARTFFCVALTMRIETWAACSRWLAWLAFDVLRLRRRLVLENLRHAFPQWSPQRQQSTARRMWEHLLLAPVEASQFRRKIHAHCWRKYLTLRRTQEFTRWMISGRPILLVGGHFGNFDLGGDIFALFGYENYGVARPLDNPYLDAWFYHRRRVPRQHVLAKKGDYAKIRDILAAGGAVTLLADQYAGSKGCWVNFFNRPASTHKAIALFALDAEAVVLVGHCRRVGGPLEYEMTLDGVADVRELDAAAGTIRDLTQWFTTRIEEGIRLAPEQYWWLHRRWKDNRPLYRARRKAA